MIDRAAPPGSMRYFALLYAPPEHRDAITALYIVDAEIRESAQSVNHDVAHTRLQWWRQEIDRLANASPQHPATRVLHERSVTPRRGFARLHELLVAADADLSRMTYLNMRELRAYSSRSGGTIQELIAAQLLGDATMDEPTRAAANRIGAAIREIEILRDVRQDAYDGRLYLPLDELDKSKVTLEDLRAKQVSAGVKEVLTGFRATLASDLDTAIATVPSATRPSLRPVLVIASLHRRLLDRIARRDYDVASARLELGPIEKPWVAWRAARKAG
jgi:phytoene synthase